MDKKRCMEDMVCDLYNKSRKIAIVMIEFLVYCQYDSARHQGCFMLNFKDKNMTASCSFLLTQHSNFAKKCERQAPLRVDALFLTQNFR